MLCAVPRPVSPRIIADCVEKKVGAVALFTSGFAETETEEGIATQEQITQMARDGDLLLIGPNCMGIYNRRLGVRHSTDQAAGDAGNVGVHQPERDALHQLLARGRRARGEVLEDGELRERGDPGRAGLHRLPGAGRGDRGHRDVHRGGEGRAAVAGVAARRRRGRSRWWSGRAA